MGHNMKVRQIELVPDFANNLIHQGQEDKLIQQQKEKLGDKNCVSENFWLEVYFKSITLLNI